MAASKVTIDIVTPEAWSATHFCLWRGKRSFGLVLAFAPTVFAFGLEVVGGNAKVLAVMIGPFWVGFATAKVS